MCTTADHIHNNKLVVWDLGLGTRKQRNEISFTYELATSISFNCNLGVTFTKYKESHFLVILHKAAN